MGFPLPAFKNGSTGSTYPPISFVSDSSDPIILTAAGGTVTVSGSIANAGAFVYGSPALLQAEGQILVGGVKKSTVSINETTGALTQDTTVTVSAGDEVALVLQAPRQLADSVTGTGTTQTWIQNSFVYDVPVGGTGSKTFGVRTPPEATDLYGWGAAGGGAGLLKWSRKYSSSGDGQAATITTRLYQANPDKAKSKTFTPTSTSTQTLTSDFDKADATGEQVEVVIEQPLGEGQAVTLGLLFTDPSKLPALSGSLPADAIVTQSDDNDALKFSW